MSLSIPGWQKETRLIAGVKRHPVILNATAQLDARHCYQGKLTHAITAVDYLKKITVKKRNMEKYPD